MTDIRINIIIILIIITLFGCQEYKKICLNKIEYISQKESLVPSVININTTINDYDLQKKIDNNQLKRVFFYSIKKEFRDYFVFFKTIKKEDGIYDFKILTSFFDANRSFNNYKTERNKWKKEEIEKILNGDVGLIFENDTIILKNCK